jgi:hypothetical protein
MTRSDPFPDGITGVIDGSMTMRADQGTLAFRVTRRSTDVAQRSNTATLTGPTDRDWALVETGNATCYFDSPDLVSGDRS